MAKVKVVICPYCGETQQAGEKCRACGGLFEPLSRQATLNAMGPWFVRDEARPFQPGASYETIARLVDRGRITKYTIVRGPTTKQLWTIAKRTPGIAHLLGYCHSCDASVDPKDLGCPECGAPFGAYLDRNYLGLPEVQPMPWQEDESDQSHASAYGTRYQELRPQATGISSFATDDEIRGNGARGHVPPAAEPGGRAPAPGVATSEADIAHQATETRFAEPVTIADDALVTARQRAMERRLRQQTRLVWTLGVLLLVALSLAIAAGFGAFSGNAPKVDQPDRTQEAADASDANDAEPAVPEPPVDEASGAPGGELEPFDPDQLPEPGEPGEGAGEQNGADSGSRESGGDGDGESTTTAAPDEGDVAVFEAEIAEAEKLIDRSNSESATLDERIEALESAIEILENVRANAPENVRPDGLDERIESLKRDLRRLEVEKWFPD